ncbi:MAG TPA: hypothetical protein VLV89_07380 [Candidatus Acidoferrum sp.]|nr:hypothetical protein [Candidatus Acidoferrum sp.]
MGLGSFRRLALLLIVVASAVVGATEPRWQTTQTAQATQPATDLPTFFKNTVGLTAAQISSIQSGKAVAVALNTPTPEEIYLFGAVYINAAPETYLAFSRDLNQMRQSPDYLAVVRFSNPPQLSDLNNFGFADDEVQDLKKCKPGNCEIQIPAESLTALQQSVNWSAPNVDDQVNQLVRASILKHLLAYQSGGDPFLLIYNDKSTPTNVSADFQYVLDFSKSLTQYLPDFYNYLLSYPQGQPKNVDNWFYWSNVKFGLKPTLRVVQVVTLTGAPGDAIAYAIAEKQLYSSHYFETALDMTFCVRAAPPQTGFYLLMAEGSEQAGLTGLTGSIVRKVAVDKSVTALQQALTGIKQAL